MHGHCSRPRPFNLVLGAPKRNLANPMCVMRAQVAYGVAAAVLPEEFTLSVPSSTPGQDFDLKTVKWWWVGGRLFLARLGMGQVIEPLRQIMG